MSRPVIAFRNVLNFIMIIFTREEEALLIFSEHPSSQSVVNGIFIAQFLVFCVVFCSKKNMKNLKQTKQKRRYQI